MTRFGSISIGAALLLSTGIASAATTDLLITAVYDGPLNGGTPKGVELYVLNDIADLSIYGLGVANNGGGTDGIEFTLSGSASAGDYIYVTNNATNFATFFGLTADFTSSKLAANGDDAIELFMNGLVVDVLGDVNVDGTLQAWDYLDGWAYRVSETLADGSFTLANWTFSGRNVFDGETLNATAATSMPIGTYTYTMPEVDAPVPLPATGLMLMGGIGLATALRRR
ncbi:MAG: VPLPA-CTERM sorting domain-containing protein [Mangrovicoccus sp.]